MSLHRILPNQSAVLAHRIELLACLAGAKEATWRTGYFFVFLVGGLSARVARGTKIASISASSGRTIARPTTIPSVMPTTGCAHAVPENSSAQGSGFNKGMQRLRDEMNRGGHRVHRVWWGNTTKMQQCNEKWAGSNGWTWWAYIA